SSKTNVQQPFKVNVSRNNKAFIWDAKNHRIVGSFVGSLPRYPLQNQLLGLPLSLMPEEVTLLLSKVPTKSQIEEFEKNKSENENQQLQDYLHEHETSLIKAFAPTITIKTSSTSFEWYNDNDCCFNSLEVARLAGLWTWPSTPKEEYKFK
ncbi:16457_t:CDS:2, partial [Racocetra fulgida]